MIRSRQGLANESSAYLSPKAANQVGEEDRIWYRAEENADRERKRRQIILREKSLGSFSRVLSDNERTETLLNRAVVISRAPQAGAHSSVRARVAARPPLGQRNLQLPV